MDNIYTKAPPIKFEDTIEYEEQKAFKQILPELKEHLVFLDEIYMFCFNAGQSLNVKTYNQVSKTLRCQLMILMRITDFLRSIRFLVINGYPEQACTLASSIFELAHTAAYFLHTPEAADKWYGFNDIEANMPQLLGVNGYKDLVKRNYAYKNIQEFSTHEYNIYRQLCWIKHSHPIMQTLTLKENKAQFRIGPYTDEDSINHAWFCIQHSCRLAIVVINNLETLKDEEAIRIKLEALEKTRIELSKKALARFRSDDPFIR